MADTDKDKDLDETKRIMERLVKTPPKIHETTKTKSAGKGSVVPDISQPDLPKEKTAKRR